MLAMSLDPPITQSRTFAISAATVAASPAAATVVDEDFERVAASPPWVYAVSVREPCEFTAKLGDLDRRFNPLANSSILTSFRCTLAASNRLLTAVTGRCIQYEFGTSASR